MPPLETADRYQKAVYWAKTGNDADGGIKVSSTKKELTVRWETSKDEILAPNGDSIAIDAKVVLDQAVVVGSIMWKGKLNDCVLPYSDLWEVVSYTEVPSLKNRNVRRVASLIRYGDTLPATS